MVERIKKKLIDESESTEQYNIFKRIIFDIHDEKSKMTQVQKYIFAAIQTS